MSFSKTRRGPFRLPILARGGRAGHTARRAPGLAPCGGAGAAQRARRRGGATARAHKNQVFFVCGVCAPKTLLWARSGPRDAPLLVVISTQTPHSSRFPLPVPCGALVVAYRGCLGSGANQANTNFECGVFLLAAGSASTQQPSTAVLSARIRLRGPQPTSGIIRHTRYSSGGSSFRALRGLGCRVASACRRRRKKAQISEKKPLFIKHEIRGSCPQRRSAEEFPSAEEVCGPAVEKGLN